MNDLTKRSDLHPTAPASAPEPGFDPGRANYFDVFSPHYYNLETVQTLMREGGGPLLREVESVAVEYVYNPEQGEDSGDWKPIIHFVGGGPSLVVNQTRAKVLMEASKSIHVGQWHQVGWLEIWVGIQKGTAQILIRPAAAPDGDSNGKKPVNEEIDSNDAVARANDLLFG